jgi:hypothetical protein
MTIHHRDLSSDILTENVRPRNDVFELPERNPPKNSHIGEAKFKIDSKPYN